MHALRTWIGFFAAGCLTACQAWGPADRPTAPLSPPVGPVAQAARAASDSLDLGARTGATVTIRLSQADAFTTKGAPPVAAAYLFQLRDAGTNAVVSFIYWGAPSFSFTNVPAGTYYARIDAVDGAFASIVVGGAQNSTNQVTVTGGTATYTSGFSLSAALTYINGTGGSVPIAITNPYAGGYGELINNATGALISQYDSGTSSFHLQQVVDGTYRFWGMGRTGGYATLARQAANVTVSGNGGSVSGSWNLNIPNLITTIAGGGGSAMANGLSPTGVSLPAIGDMIYDAAGNLIATAGNQVIMVPRSGGTFYGVPMAAGLIYTIAGAAGAGNTGDTGAATSALLSAPSGLAVDSGGNLYIADTGNQRIRIVSSGGTINPFAGSTGGYSGDGGAAATAQLSSPQGLLMVGGTLYVADSGNNVVRTIAGGIINTATIPGLNGPTRLLRDASGNFVIAEAGGNRIAVYAPAPGTFYNLPMAAGAVTTVASGASMRSVAVDTGGHVYFGDSSGRVAVRAINGTTFTIANGGGSGGDGGPASGGFLNQAVAMAFDPISGGLAVVDSLNGRIRLIN